MKPVVNIVLFVVVCCLKLVASSPFPEDFARYLAAAYSSASASEGLRENLQNQQTDYRRAQRQLTGFDNQFNNAHSQPIYPSTINAGVDRNIFQPANNENINFNGPREVFHQASNNFEPVGDSSRYPQTVANEPPRLSISRTPLVQTQFYGIPRQQNFEQINQMRHIPDPISIKINNNAREVERQFVPLHQQRNEFPPMNVVQQPFIPQTPILNRIRKVPPKPLPTSQEQSITNQHVPPSNYQQSSLQVGNTNDPNPYKEQRSNIPPSINDPNIQRIITGNKFKKRYLVIHPNGNVEHLDNLDYIIQKHPNYVLLNSERRETPTSVIKHNDPNNFVSNINNDGMTPNTDLQNQAANDNRQHSNIVPTLEDNKTTQIQSTNKNETNTEKPKTDASLTKPIVQIENVSKKEHDNIEVNTNKATLTKKRPIQFSVSTPSSPVMPRVPDVKSNTNNSQISIKVKVINDDGIKKPEKHTYENNTLLTTPSEKVGANESLPTTIKKPQTGAPKRKLDETATKHENITEPPSKQHQPTLDKTNSPNNKNPEILEVIPIKSKLNVSAESTNKSSNVSKDKPGSIIEPKGNVKSSDSKLNDDKRLLSNHTNAAKNKKGDIVLPKKDLSIFKTNADHKSRGKNESKNVNNQTNDKKSTTTVNTPSKPSNATASTKTTVNNSKCPNNATSKKELQHNEMRFNNKNNKTVPVNITENHNSRFEASGNVNSSVYKPNGNKRLLSNHTNSAKNKNDDIVLPKKDLPSLKTNADHKSKKEIETEKVNNKTNTTTNDKKITTTVKTPSKQSNATALTTTTIDNSSGSNNVTFKKHLQHNESRFNNITNKATPVKITEKHNFTKDLKESSGKANTTADNTAAVSTTKQSSRCINSTSASKEHQKHIDEKNTEEHLKKMLEMVKNLTDEDFTNKVVIFQIVMPPVIDKDVHTTIYPNGTIIDEITETIWDTEDEYGEPEVFTKTYVRHIDDPEEDVQDE